MRSLRRLITVVLALAMILTSVGIPAFAASFSDITDQKVADAVDKLVAYSIITGYEDGTFKPDNQITRAEFAAIVTRMKGVADSIGTDAVTGFSDLDNDASRAWARPYVKAAVDLKIINGFEDGTFRAAEPVTYEQAVKMLVCAVGYDVVAKSEYNKAIASNPNATWSAGYIAAANKHGITKGVITAQITQPAARGVVAVLTSNSLEVPALVPDENGNLTKPEEGKQEEELGNKVTVSGVITQTYYTGLGTQDTGLGEREISIRDNDGETETYTLNEEFFEKINLDEYIGRRVDAYYDKYEDEVTSITIRNTGKSIFIDEGAIEKITDNSIQYRVNGKLQTESLLGYTYIVNGKYVEEYDFDNEFKNGKIELFTSNGTKVAKIDSYHVMVVSSFDKTNEKIYLKYAQYKGQNYYQFPTSTASKPQILVKSASASTYTETAFSGLSLSAYDVINYQESPEGSDGPLMSRMYVTKGSKSGTVNESSSDDREVVIGEKTLYLTNQYYDYTPTGSDEEKAPFEIRENYTYYLDYTGQIAAVKYSSTANAGSFKYGYLVKADEQAKEIGIFDTNGNYEAYTFKSSIRLDGEKTSSSSAIFARIKEAASTVNANKLSDATVNAYSQPIRYSASGRVIDMLDTIVEEEGGVNDNFTYDGQIDGDAGSSTSTKVVVDGTSFDINSSTIVLYVPNNRTDWNSYAVMKNNTAFATTANRYTEVFAYDQTSEKAKLVLVYGANPTHVFTGSSPYMLVSNVRSDGDIIEGYEGTSTEAKPINVSEDNFYTNLGDDEEALTLVSKSQVDEGDVIRYIKDNSGDIIAIQMIYDASEGTGLNVGENGYFVDTDASDIYIRYGVVDSKDSVDNTVKISCAGSEKTYKTSSTKFFKTSSDGEVTTTVVDEVNDGKDGRDASTVIVVSRSASDGSLATVIYIFE